MKEPTSFFIHNANLEFCQELVKSGEFNSVSEVIGYAMRLYSESLRLKGSCIPATIDRKDIVKVSMRVDVFVLNDILDRGMLERNVIADQSLNYYIVWRSNFKNKE